MTVTQRAVATTFDEAARFRPAYWQGPLVLWLGRKAKVAGPSPSAMLTKTNCKGFGVHKELRHPADDFWRTCITTQAKVGRVWWPAMNNTLVSCAIHLIPDPFDNIVARMHFDKAFNHSRKGLLRYCDKVDKIRQPALLEAINALNTSATTKEQMMGTPVSTSGMGGLIGTIQPWKRHLQKDFRFITYITRAT